MNDGATLTAASRANRVEVTGAAGRGQRQPRLRLNSTAGIYSHRPREPVVVNMASGGATGPRRTPWTTRDWATLTAEQRREVGVRVHVARGGREAGGRRRWRRRRRRCPTGARQDQNRLIRNPLIRHCGWPEEGAVALHCGCKTYFCWTSMKNIFTSMHMVTDNEETTIHVEYQ